MFGKTTGERTLEEKTVVSHRADLLRSSARARSATAGPTPPSGHAMGLWVQELVRHSRDAHQQSH